VSQASIVASDLHAFMYQVAHMDVQVTKTTAKIKAQVSIKIATIRPGLSDSGQEVKETSMSSTHDDRRQFSYSKYTKYAHLAILRSIVSLVSRVISTVMIILFVICLDDAS
jgi:hypothetical protein